MMEALPYSADCLRFCKALPKIELHAHLNGSIRESTIRELAEKQGLSAETLGFLSKTGTRSLPEGFKLFAVIHTITTTHAILTRITREVIEDCADDNIVHLELRTTPKDRPEHGMTKASYCSAVLAGLQQYRSTQESTDRAQVYQHRTNLEHRQTRDSCSSSGDCGPCHPHRPPSSHWH